jgi:hypothetical protein
MAVSQLGVLRLVAVPMAGTGREEEEEVVVVVDVPGWHRE